MPLRNIRLETSRSDFPEKIFNKSQRDAIISNALTRMGKLFKQETKDKMIKGPHTGKIYRKRTRGEKFSRSHRASRRGERPSPDTLNLLNSVKDRRPTGNSVEIFVDDGQAPYGKYLQSERLDRPIMTQLDAAEFISAGPGKNQLDGVEAELSRE